MPMAFEIYGACSKTFDEFLCSVVKIASEINSIPYSVLLSYWRRRISTTLQIYNARLINEGYLRLFDNGGGNLHREIDVDHL